MFYRSFSVILRKEIDSINDRRLVMNLVEDRSSIESIFLVLTQLPRPEKVDENCIGVGHSSV